MRIYNVDFLRGLAVLMVLLVHASSSTIPWIEESPLHQIFEIGKYGVEVFFVISGYIICYSLFRSKYSLRSSFHFLAKRFIRINPPAYVIMIAYLLIELCTYLFTGNYLILSDPFESKLLSTNLSFTASLFGTDYYIGPFWTLEVELQFYLTIAFIFPFLTHKLTFIRYLALAGMLLLGACTMPFALSEYVACFLLGVAYFLLQNRFMNATGFVVLLALILSVFLINAQYFELLFSSLSLLVITLKKPIKSAVFQYLGRISYSLYILHIFVFMYLDVVLNRLNLNHLHTSIPTKVIVIIVYSGIAILFSHLFYLYVEKPFIAYSKKIKL
ncbi:MAG: acyltransferase family protein [Crocinitomicaceae bacterium]